MKTMIVFALITVAGVSSSGFLRPQITISSSNLQRHHEPGHDDVKHQEQGHGSSEKGQKSEKFHLPVIFSGKHHEPGHNSEPIYGNGVPGDKAEIVAEEREINNIGSWRFLYLQTDRQFHSQHGNVDRDDQTHEIKLDRIYGDYRYVRPDGKIQFVEYIADKDGFRPIVLVKDTYEDGI